MPVYQVSGASSSTGEEKTLNITAETPDQASEYARISGIFVSSVVPKAEPINLNYRSTGPRLSWLSQIKHPTALAVLIVIGAFGLAAIGIAAVSNTSGTSTPSLKPKGFGMDKQHFEHYREVYTALERLDIMIEKGSTYDQYSRATTDAALALRLAGSDRASVAAIDMSFAITHHERAVKAWNDAILARGEMKQLYETQRQNSWDEAKRSMRQIRILFGRE